MKDDVLNLVAKVATVIDIWTWLLAGAALVPYMAAAWVAYRLGRIAGNAIARANRLVRHEVGPDALRLLQELDAHLDQTVAADPELAAGFHRLRTAIDQARKETP